MIEGEAGTEDEEMTMTCIASGGYPASTITWVMPDGVNFTVEEEVTVNVRTIVKHIEYRKIIFLFRKMKHLKQSAG